MSKLTPLNILTTHINWSNCTRNAAGRFVGPVSFNTKWPWIAEELKRWNKNNTTPPTVIIATDANYSYMKHTFVLKGIEYVAETESYRYVMQVTEITSQSKEV